MLEGDRSNEARLFRQLRLGAAASQMVARKIHYWPNSNRVNVDEANMLDLTMPPRPAKRTHSRFAIPHFLWTQPGKQKYCSRSARKPWLRAPCGCMYPRSPRRPRYRSCSSMISAHLHVQPIGAAPCQRNRGATQPGVPASSAMNVRLRSSVMSAALGAADYISAPRLPLPVLRSGSGNRWPAKRLPPAETCEDV